jgi:two-component system, response regulator / RNA-binding antiterminator
MTEQSLRILLVDQNVARASILEEGLREAGCVNVTVVRDMQNLLRRIVDEDPDVIFIDLENPNRDVLEQMFQVSRCVRRPVAMFVDRSDTDMIKAAVESGVGAYIVDGLRKERVKAVLDMAVSRFNAFRQLHDELDRAKQELEDRKVIERAKGILMKERSLSEEAAYGLLRKAAMNENRRLAEVAHSVVTAARLLK